MFLCAVCFVWVLSEWSTPDVPFSEAVAIAVRNCCPPAHYAPERLSTSSHNADLRLMLITLLLTAVRHPRIGQKNFTHFIFCKPLPA